MEIKKFTLIIILIANIGLVKAQYTAIPDMNFEQALIDQGIDSEGTFDGQILTNDINTITVLNVMYKDILSLEGIQNFTLLEVLECRGNYISVLNLTNNLYLKGLDCPFNNLSSLNLNSNLLLTNLACHNNQITILNIENCINLITIGCANNFLNNLNLNNLTNLILLDISNNNINTLSFNSNLALEKLYCGQNNLVSLNLSNNTSIDVLNCVENNLNTLTIQNGVNNLLNGMYAIGSNTYNRFNATDNPNLHCIFVDDATNSTANWLSVDATSTFVETQTACDALAIPNYNIETMVTIYPNPTQSFFKIETTVPIKKIKLFNSFGKLIKTFKNQDTYKISSIEKGIYQILIETEEFNKSTKLIIK